MSINIEKVCNIINGNKSFAIYSHLHADIDAVGSSLALKRALEKMGKIAHVFIDSTFPSNTKMFEDINKINFEKQKEYDVAIVVDCADEDRLGRLKYKFRKNAKTVLSIDHHLGNNVKTQNNYLDVKVSSTCEIIYNVIKALNVSFDSQISKLLISGIYTDTGGLKFSTTFTSTYKTLSNLLDSYGDTLDKISMPLYNSLSKEAFDLKKLAYNNLELFEDNKLALITITADEFKKLNVKFDETKGLTDVAMQLESVKVLALMSEDPREIGTYYVSLRAKDDYSAKAIAESFGGGGHLKASGCKIIESLEKAKALLIEACRKELLKK